jgi:hypothetical protein
MVNFIQTRIPLAITYALRNPVRACRLHRVMQERSVTTKIQIRATAKALCFRACTDCKSADECDPDDNWMVEARAALEADKIKSKSKLGNLHNRSLFAI